MTEVWKDISGYEGLYQVSNLGRVKSIARLDKNKNGRPLPIKERIMVSISNGVGHLKVGLSIQRDIKRFYVHRLVATHFIPNPDDKPMINHKDGDPSNNNVNNIEWVTMRENVVHGLKKRGSRKKSSQFSGVHLCYGNTHKKWKSMLFVNGEHKFIGNFYTEEEAHEAYKQALIDNSVTNKYAHVANN